MKNLLKFRNFVIIFIAIFSIFVFSKGESFAIAPENSPTVEKTVSQDDSSPQTILEKNAYDLSHMQKTGYKYGIYKFFTAMFGVLVSVIAIYFGLKLYKKIALKNNEKLDNIKFDKSLESPKDFKEAINLFLDKTDK